MRPRLTRRRLAAGFTLIELVVVLAILVILAGGVLVKLDVLQLRANKGVAASDMAGISRMMQTYFVANNHYPDGFDSLVDSSATHALWGQTTTAPVEDDPTTHGLDPQLIDGFGTSHKKLTTSVLTAGEVNSLGRVGITSVFDVSLAGTGFPSDRFDTRRALDLTVPADGTVAIVNATTNGSATNDGDAADLMLKLYPNATVPGTPPAGHRVVAFGLGPHTTIVGRSGLMQTAPLYANSTNRNVFYARDLVLFEVDAGGGRARFLAAYGADCDRLDEELTEYYEIQ